MQSLLAPVYPDRGFLFVQIPGVGFGRKLLIPDSTPLGAESANDRWRQYPFKGGWGIVKITSSKRVEKCFETSRNWIVGSRTSSFRSALKRTKTSKHHENVKESSVVLDVVFVHRFVCMNI